jgi:uncharacterized protein YvpB
MIITTLKFVFTCLLIVGLVFISSGFTVLLYMKITGKEDVLTSSPRISLPAADVQARISVNDGSKKEQPKTNVRKKFAMIDAPVVLQKPEFRNGCELTALTMLFQFYGIQKDKLELLPEMKKDPTKIQLNKDGTIQYWGHPNAGFVGDITGKEKGFGIYHAALFELLKKYIPTGVDLTESSFAELEQQVAEGIPVLIWTTVNFTVPSEEQWVVWDSPLGPVRTTFQEHTVLLVGYDDKHVYVNDPLSGKKQHKIEKDQFIASWEALGKQALSYMLN